MTLGPGFHLELARKVCSSNDAASLTWGCLHALIYIAEDIHAIRETLEREHGSLQLNSLAEEVSSMQQIDKSVGSPASLGNTKEQE